MYVAKGHIGAVHVTRASQLSLWREAKEAVRPHLQCVWVEGFDTHLIYDATVTELGTTPRVGHG